VISGHCLASAAGGVLLLAAALPVAAQGPLVLQPGTITRNVLIDLAGQDRTLPGAPTLRDATLTLTNSAANASVLRAQALAISGGTGLRLEAASGGGTALGLAGGIVRDQRATLSVEASPTASLGGPVQVLMAEPPALTNGILPPWITVRNGATYDFATYGLSGLATGSYTRTTLYERGPDGLQPPSSRDVVRLGAGDWFFAPSVAMHALTLDPGALLFGPVGPRAPGSVVIGSGGLIMNGARIRTSFLAFFDEGVITTAGQNEIEAKISGTGGITFTGSGTTVLQIASANTGPFVLNSGTLLLNTPNALAAARSVSLGDAALDRPILHVFGPQQFATLSGGGIVNMVADATLRIAGAGPPFTGELTGTGHLTVDGGLTLFGRVAVPRTDIAGSLIVGDGANRGAVLQSTVSVSPKGTLGGTGTVAGDVANGGIVVAGAAETAGPLRITGTYTQARDATLRVVLDPAGVGGLVVGQTATLGGTLALQPNAPLTAYVPGTQYTVVRAGALIGQFDAIDANLLVGVIPSYDATTAFITLRQQSLLRFAQTPNQTAVASALDHVLQAAFGPEANPEALALFTTISSIPAASVPEFLNRASGTGYSQTGSIAIGAVRGFMSSVRSQAIRLPGAEPYLGDVTPNRMELAAIDPLAPGSGAPDRPWTLFTSSRLGWTSIAAASGAPGTDSTMAGVTVAADYRLTPAVRAGLAFGYDNTQSVTGTPGDRGRLGLYQFALYAAAREGRFTLSGLAGGGFAEGAMTRTPVAGDQPTSVNGRLAGAAAFATTELGALFDLPGSLSLTPFAGLDGVIFHQNRVEESPQTALGLSVAAQTTTSLRGRLGVRLGRPFSVGGTVVSTELVMGWAHEFADTQRPLTAGFAGIPAAAFTVAGTPAPRNQLIAGAGFGARIADHIDLFARYDGAFGGNTTENVVRGGVRMVW